jgi:hypothetical protein
LKYSTKQYGKLPTKIPVDVPWFVVYVDHIGPFSQSDHPNATKYYALSIIDPATSCSILASIHQVIGNIICTSNLSESLWVGLLPAVAFAICGTFHTTLQATLCQLCLESDLILDASFTANGSAIVACKLRQTQLTMPERINPILPILMWLVTCSTIDASCLS